MFFTTESTRWNAGGAEPDMVVSVRHQAIVMNEAWSDDTVASLAHEWLGDADITIALIGIPDAVHHATNWH